MLKNKNSQRGKNVSYNPNLGFIGNSEVSVANYLFSAKRMRSAYKFSRPLVKMILEKQVSEHYKDSKKLTKFLKVRDLTFSKMTSKGAYKTFTVPCTTTVVPLQKSIFNEVETAAQALVISLRKVLQDIYGSKDLKSSKFVKSLPKEVKEIFINAIDESAHYYKALHHPNMKDYPFFDNVGLDLVLVEDYLNKVENFSEILENNNFSELPGLPFRILELNAGSPSGASNNMNMLEGMHKGNPEILKSLGKMMPNDHFKILGETYKSLGENWTGRKDGVQVLLPPGGSNGAAPEIHQLAAYSGLIYADPVQLFSDDEGYIRLRTITGSNPIVTAIYSRINSDSALFDPDKDIILRDPDSGEPIYLRDNLKLGKDGAPPLILDAKGNPIPLQSDYAIPGAVDAVVNKKLYLGGLNRIMDNKIILATLTHYAPKFFSEELERLGLSAQGSRISPPQTLPPTKKSVEVIKNDPDQWVVKAPDLAGGSGVYILKTLPTAKKREILDMITEEPDKYAYQQLVKIGRIPVAVNRKDGHRFANLAADIRMWVFFGGGKDELPRMTHNALVRYAPQERGSMSSIVNTSKGGGYAPFVIVDDTNNPDAVTADQLVIPNKPKELQTELPTFVAAQMVQISRLMNEIHTVVQQDDAYAYEVLGLALGLKLQCKEILSFLHPRAIESVYKIIDICEAKISKIEVAEYFNRINNNQMELVSLLKKYEGRAVTKTFKDIVDNIFVINIDMINVNYTKEDNQHDKAQLKELRKLIKAKNVTNPVIKKDLNRIVSLIKASVDANFNRGELATRTKGLIANLITNFATISKTRLLDSGKGEDFAKLFDTDFKHNEFKFETLYLGEDSIHSDTLIATQKEFATGQLLTETDVIDQKLRDARNSWLKVVSKAAKMKKSDAEKYISRRRKAHFEKFAFLNRYQELINSNSSSVDDLIEILPILPYAKYNLEQFAKQQGVALKDLFSTRLKENRVCVLSSEQIKKKHLSGREHAGECFAKKRRKHGLFSNSDIFIWIRKELDPFTLIYTAGHEIIHYQQIRETMKKEKNAIRTSAMEQANFLNYYGNFIGVSSRSLESLTLDIRADRRPLYGFADRIVPYFTTPLITELRNSLNGSQETWDKKLDSYGSLFGYMMPNSTQVRVKALQEILPALENAKNITFAKELGLEINYDEIKSSLPTANDQQLKQYAATLKKAIKSPKIEMEALRVIASHQYFGVYFPRLKDSNRSLTLRPTLQPISLGNSYNQTQQQQ